jgi:hypothetical protein
MDVSMSISRATTAKAAKAPLTPRMKAGKKLFKSAQSDLRDAQRKLDSARALRRAARSA